MANSSTSTAENQRPNRRVAPLDAKRLPGAASSLNVLERNTAISGATSSSTTTSLPRPSNSSQSVAKKKSHALESMHAFLSSTTDAKSPIQPTDIQLLTTSILSNAERQAVILQYQEKLIDSCPSLDELKKALLYLSTSSWGQILEERHLVRKCAYPPCSNPSPLAFSSLTSTAKKVGKFRINLGSQKVTATDDLDLGEAGHSYQELKHCFCGKPCYARSEWVLRWILSDKEIGFAAAPSSTGDLGPGSARSGNAKWEKLTSNPKGYQELELLEDIEAQQGFDLLNTESSTLKEDDPTESIVPAEGNRPIKALAKIDRAKDTSKMLDKLPVIERTKPPSASLTNTASPSRSQATVSPSAKVSATIANKIVAPTRTTFDVDVPNHVGRKFTPTARHPSAANLDGTDHDEDDNDIDLREMEMNKILRFASLASGSRPRRKNTTITLTTAPTNAASNSADDEVDAVAGADEAEWEQELTPQQAADQREIRRIMDLALGVREEQRELGLLD